MELTAMAVAVRLVPARVVLAMVVPAMLVPAMLVPAMLVPAMLVPARALAQSSAHAASGGEAMGSLFWVLAFTVIPFALLATTSFVKISVVFHILKSALGAADVPSSMVITAFAVLLSAYVMAPVASGAASASGDAISRVDFERPFSNESVEALSDAYARAVEPLRDFLTANSGERERALFLELAETRSGLEVTQSDLLVLIPAFMITELAEAFQIGFLVFVPFLVVDLLVSNVLMSLGMHMLSPTKVSMPFKLLLFVLVDGWYVLSRALILGYA